MAWKNLPLEGRIVKEFSWGGNGKDGGFELELEGPAQKIELECSGIRMLNSLQGNWETSIEAWDDSSVIHTFLPQEPMVLEYCSIEFNGDDEEYDECLLNFAKGDRNFMSYGISDIKIKARPSA